MKIAAFILALWPMLCLAADPVFPSAEGTTWNYEMVQEHPSADFDLTDPNEEEHFVVSYRIGATEKIENKDLQRLEIYRAEALETVDLIAIEEAGINCPARMNADGSIVKLIPPQQMLALPLQSGKGWTFDGTIGETKVRQRYEIAGEEDVEVPAGKFRAWRIRCGQTLPAPATIDRWFVPGTGFVKVETTVKGPSGALLQKTTLQLKEPPKVVTGAPQVQTKVEGKGFKAGLSSEAKGDFKTEFKSDTAAIFARWSGRSLPEHAEVRARFIAENVADVSADYEIDEARATAPKADSSGVFTLSKPDGGWTPGRYRVEFFVNAEPAQTVKFKISK
ncbi:MAG TPA: hypothetical protein VIU85_03695 [Chthoniobacterales bacterium]